jgi:hypothetical protein
MRFDTKIAIAIRADLPVWQKLNVAAFLASAIAGADKELIGQAYEDGSGVRSLAMFRQPVLIFAASGEDLARAHARSRERNLPFALYTEQMFTTGHDDANRAAVRAVATDALALVGLALHGERKDVDRVTKGMSLHP